MTVHNMSMLCVVASEIPLEPKTLQSSSALNAEILVFNVGYYVSNPTTQAHSSSAVKQVQ